MVLASVLCGFCGYSMVILSYILAADFCHDKLRQKTIAIINLSWSIAMVSFYPMYLWCN